MRRLLPLLVLVLAACAREPVGARLPTHPLVVGNTAITVEVAANAEDRRKGLMHREFLPEDHGMLFIFPTEAVHAFWMKNTPLPLSIAYADAGGRIVRIADMEPYSLKPVGSERPARFALEMNQGWFERRGVFEGDAIQGIPQVPVD